MNKKSYSFDEHMEILPFDIKIILWEQYLTQRDKLFVSKHNYEKNHQLIFHYYPHLNNNKRGYLQMLAKYNCYYIIDLIIKSNPTFLYTPKMDLRLYYNKNVYYSYLTFIKAIALKNKAFKSIDTINNFIYSLNSKISEDSTKTKKKNREKKNFKTKKYIKEWEN